MKKKNKFEEKAGANLRIIICYSFFYFLKKGFTPIQRLFFPEFLAILP